MSELIQISLNRLQWDFIVRTLAEQPLPFCHVAPIMAELARQLQSGQAQPPIPAHPLAAMAAAMVGAAANGAAEPVPIP